MLEFRHLSYLLVACEHENLTQAAEELNIAPSTLSGSLKALEAEFGFPLFKRLGGGLYPRRSARWLFRASLFVLLLEGHARRSLRAHPGHDPRILTVNIRPLFTIGRISRGVLRAIAATQADDPAVLINPVWTEDQPTPFDAAWVSRLGYEGEGVVTLDLAGPDAPALPGETQLLRDPWVLAFRSPGPRVQEPPTSAALCERTLIVPAFASQDISDRVDGYLRQHRLRRVKVQQYHPGSLPRLLNEQPDAAFLLPGSALAGRMGLLNVRSIPLDPPMTSRLVATVDRPCAIAKRFILRLKDAFDAPHAGATFTPELTTRRVRYFNLAHRIRSVSAAARVANVAQPALGEQLRKLELTLGGRLFDRHSDGVSPSPLGALFAPAALLLEESLQNLKSGGVSSASSAGGRLSVGVLPSVNQHGLLVNRIADAISAAQSAFPALKVTVHEAPNGTLQDWVMQGIVGLAIVETGPAQMPRLPLGSSEPLAVIAHPRHVTLPPGPIRLAELADLRLALPTSLSGLRQLLEAAALAERIKLRPVMQIDALPMLITLLQRENICTVLPPSAVHKELETGELRAHTIIDPQVVRRMFVIYSGERSLTAPEREFVTLLRGKLAETHAREPLDVFADAAGRVEVVEVPGSYGFFVSPASKKHTGAGMASRAVIAP